MKLMPMDIQQQQFRRTFRGYQVRDVQQFLEWVAQQMTEVIRENTELRDTLQTCQRSLEELRSREASLREAMLTAQQAINERREQTQKETQLALDVAQMQAEKIVNQAHTKARHIEEETNDLKRLRIRFVEEFRGILNTYGRLLDTHGPVLSSSVASEAAEASLPVLDRLRPPVAHASEEISHV